MMSDSENFKMNVGVVHYSGTQLGRKLEPLDRWGQTAAEIHQSELPHLVLTHLNCMHKSLAVIFTLRC